MSNLTIKTNNHYYELVNAWDMDPRVLRNELGWGKEEFSNIDDGHQFVKYKNVWYDISDFMTTIPGSWNHGLPTEFSEWDGYASDSFFSGVLIRYNKVEIGDMVQMGTYISQG